MPEDNSGATVLRVGLVGRGIGASLTPQMHMRQGQALGLTYTYDLIDPDTTRRPDIPIADILDDAEARGFRGLNITYPYKQAVMPHLDALSVTARTVGAVNTVLFTADGRKGHNTDCWGFAEGFRRGLPRARCDAVLLLGAGGAGGAVAHALRQLGAGEIAIHDTHAAAAASLAHRVDGVVVHDLDAAARAADGIVNATPMGMEKLPGTAIDTGLLTPRHWVADIVYFPRETALLRAAKARGCATLDGAGMAIFQAVRAFQLFTGHPADPDQMRATFEALTSAS